ncbi:CoA transferase [Burkholderia sp. Bp9012]|uniref:CaiB/BaiF CoA transferase family protein n=1 Tax=Burkholderia sp. Bp9012 TaxID=2184562 RepID=UPI000F5A4D4A|nr:CoA transferase [Burkholderia sp. Bp9012]RQR71611.1 CoA transferase [Burkholderia sp. Bp9012]
MTSSNTFFEKLTLLPLKRIRVIDTSHVIAGPLATHQLCMLGAEVIKIERPAHGDALRGLGTSPELGGLTPAFIGLNAGKKSVALHLDSPLGQRALYQLIADADVFVENFKPGTAAKLGIDAATLHAINPRLIYCSISGWGQEGDYAARGAYDHVIQAATGMMTLQGSDPLAPPVKVGFPIIDAATGQSAALAILAALLRRQAGDPTPIYIDASMVDASLQLMSSMATSYLVAGQPSARKGNRGFVDSPGSDTFPCADGWLSTGANTLGQFERLCAVIGRPELATAPRWLLRRPDGPQAFLSGCAGPDLRAELCSAFQRGRAVDWEEKLNRHNVPCSAVRSIQEYLDGPYRNGGGITSRVAQPTQAGVREIELIGAGFRWSGDQPVPMAPAPVLGKDTEEVLRRVANLNDQEIKELLLEA